MGFYKELDIIRHNEAIDIRHIMEKKWKEDRYNAEICSKCSDEFTEENPQVTDDSRLCFDCYQEMGMFP